jgi:ATP-dependent DNA helicase DinG
VTSPEPNLPPDHPVVKLPALHASHGGTWLRQAGGAQAGGPTSAISKGEAIMAAADTPVLLINAPLVAARLGYPDLSGLDLLEAFAFVHPARFCVPTPRGLAEALGLPLPGGDEDVPALLQQAAGALVAACTDPEWFEREGAWSALQSLERLRWPWAQVLKAHIAKPEKAERWLFARLPEWEEAPERPAPRQVELAPAEVLDELARLTGSAAEQREGQRAYAQDAARIFAPRAAKGVPHLALAQAGTGIGKTLGYLAPASLWARGSGGTVWVSTFTKNLQRQLRRESRRAWPMKRDDGTPPVVVRKGRENYLCLLNLEDALQGGFAGRPAILAQLVARWAAFSSDGDMIGGDLPGWLGTLFRKRGIASLTDSRGECIYAGCPHYRKCFIERAARSSAQADLVIANHALVMVNAARSGSGGARDPGQRPTRLIFDEGHHVFDAADSTFAATLSAQEAIELKRWITGPEREGRGRRRGLAARLADVASYDEAGSEAIAAAVKAAQLLPSEGWLARIHESNPFGPVEALLGAVRTATYARDESGAADSGYGIETEAADLPGEVIEAAGNAADAFAAIRVPLIRLGGRLEAVLADPPDWLDSQGRARIEGARFSLAWRIDLLAAWGALLNRLGGPVDPEFVDWLAVDRSEAREFDIAIHRRWLDPMKPFARVVLEPAHGVMLTSATLTDRIDTGDHDAEWASAIARSGAAHIETRPLMSSAISPFDYAGRAEVLIITDIRKGDLPALAGAYARVIEASEGGVLGLFTAIRRLRAVYGRIADRLARAGLPVYAQHVDPIDTGTLVDIFRDDRRASLLGTDALRDGVDVPGESLRCVVLEQVPWPRPDILHKARRAANGGSQYDDRIIRAKLAQAFGRLIRGKDDAGHFIVLSSAFPTRLLSAFPPGTPVIRLTLDEALQRVAAGVSHDSAAPEPSGAHPAGQEPA